jgi:hypothetical protein
VRAERGRQVVDEKTCGYAPHIVLNILARQRNTGPPDTILTPAALTLRHAPIADCARYDNLRRTNNRRGDVVLFSDLRQTIG